MGKVGRGTPTGDGTALNVPPALIGPGSLNTGATAVPEDQILHQEDLDLILEERVV